MEAQGFKGVFTEEGIDIEKFRKASQEVLARVGGDPRLAAQTLGLTEEAAEGFVRLSESLDRVQAAQESLRGASGDLAKQYRESMGFGESFRASINRVKKVLAEPLAIATEKGTELLSAAAQSDVGALAVTGGAASLAALLAGAGMRGVGRGLLGAGTTAVKTQAAEALLGQKTIPVYVTNASEIGGGMAGAAAGAAGSCH